MLPSTIAVTVSAERVLKTVIISVKPEVIRVETMRPVDGDAIALEIVRAVVEPDVTRVEVATAKSDDTVLLAKVFAPELEV